MPTGTLVIPPPHMVVAGFQYGAGGTEFTGTYGASDATPDIEEAVHARLSASAALAALIGERIYPDGQADPDAPRPFLVYSLDSTEAERSLDEGIGLKRHSVSVVVEAIDKADARAIAAVVRTVLDGVGWDNVQRAYWANESAEDTDDGSAVVQTYTVIQ